MAFRSLTKVFNSIKGLWSALLKFGCLILHLLHNSMLATIVGINSIILDISVQTGVSQDYHLSILLATLLYINSMKLPTRLKQIHATNGKLFACTPEPSSLLTTTVEQLQKEQLRQKLQMLEIWKKNPENAGNTKQSARIIG